ncbi:CASP-like protein PIMP1 [Coffea arabica]|uniref:CASP-like protein n=1 Tax=Coffea arabica TaxID=13443 RepID=A0A6P6WJL6_COFAR|nr:CASP-like protein PIMP1 [Coffea arabica]XP_027115634.1 CASP-like protein PIMP1 [Coffea arabica]
MAPPPSTAVSPIVSLLVRILTFVCLLISVIILITNTYTERSDYGDVKTKFTDFHAYRYLLGAIVIGLAYTLFQTALTIFLVSTGNRIGGDGMLQLDFYGDKVISYVLATGAAASFGMTQDFKRLVDRSDSGVDKFLSKADAATSLCLLGFLFAAISSIFSAFSLPKRA